MPKETETKEVVEPTVIPNPHSTVGTDEREAKANAAKVAEDKAAAAVAAKEAAEKAAAEAEATKGDLPKEETPEETDEEKAEREAKEAAETRDKPLDTETYGDTGSEVGNNVLTLIQNAGVSADDAKALLFDAVQSNDMSKIDRDALVEKVGEATANIILTGTATFAAEVAKQSKEILEAVTGAVGSAENWTKVQEWAEKTDTLSDKEAGEYNDLIKKGGASARFAASELLAKYNADAKNTEITDNPRVSADVDTSTASEAITAAEAYKRLELASRRGEDLAPIRAARARGRAKGI